MVPGFDLLDFSRRFSEAQGLLLDAHVEGGDHAAEIPTSFGGAVCMIVSIAFIGIAVMIEAWPIYLLAVRGLSPGLSRTPEWSRLPW